RKETADYELAVWANCLAIQAEARAEAQPYVLPKRFHATMTVTARPAAAPPGQVIRAWLPVPRSYPFQTGFELLASSPPAGRVQGMFSPIRSVYLEQPAQKNRPTEFRIDYAYTAYGVWFDPLARKTQTNAVDDPAISRFVQEGP